MTAPKNTEKLAHEITDDVKWADVAEELAGQRWYCCTAATRIQMSMTKEQG